MSYFGYVKRERDSVVDWKSITTNISDELTRVTEDRAKKREEVEQVNRELTDAAGNAQLGKLSTYNDMALNAAQTSKEHIYALYTLVKSGKMPVQDYHRFMQTQKSNVQALGNSFKNLQARYDEDMKRSSDPNVSSVEKSTTEAYYRSIDPSSTKYQIDNLTGLGYTVQLDEDGNVVKSKGGANSMEAILAMSNFRMDKFDTAGALKKDADKLASIAKVEGVFTINDARRNDSFSKAVTEYVNSYVSDGLTSASIGADFFGYNISYDLDADQNENIIIDHSGGYPKVIIGDKLMTDIKSKLVDQLESMVGSQITRVAPPPPREPSGRAIQEKDYVSGYGIALDIVKGGEAGAAASQKITANKSMGISNIYQDGNSIVVQREGQEDIVIDKNLNGQPLSGTDLATSILVNIYPGINPGQAEEIAQKYMKENPGVFDTIGSPTPFGSVKQEPLQKKTIQSPIPGGFDDKGGIKMTTIGDFVVNELTKEGSISADKAPLIESTIANLPADPRVKQLLSQVKVSDASTGIGGFYQKVKLTAPFLPTGGVTINFDNKSHVSNELVPLVDRILQLAQDQVEGSSSSPSGGSSLNASNRIKK